MKKFKFNYKLTTFLVGLFVSFLLIFLSGKFNICRPFGLICLGVSLILYLWEFSDKTKKIIQKINRKIEKIELGQQVEFEEDYEESMPDVDEEDEEYIEELAKEEKEFMIMELKRKKKKVAKNDKKIKILFVISGSLMIIGGVMFFF